MAKVQALIAADDKRTVLASLGGDDGVLTLVIQSAFFNAAKFIRANSLNHYDPTNYSIVLNFIRNGADTRPTISPPSHPLPGRVEDSQPTSPPTPLIAPTSRESRAGRIRNSKVLKNRKDTSG